MSNKATKQYSLPYWIKQALRHESNPEQRISEMILSFAQDPATCTVAFQGTAHDLLNAAYIEWRKYAKSVHLCLFPTPMPVARRLAEMMDLGQGDRAFDPGAGTGNLLAAAMERGAFAYGLERQHWLPSLLNIIGIECSRGDFLDQTPPLPPANVVMVNPPFGRVGESSDAATDFMDRIADISPAKTRVGAILPAEHFKRETKRRRQVFERFEVHETVPLDSSTFKPLAAVSTEILIMSVKHSGIKPTRPTSVFELIRQRQQSA
jgi:predicted RNA methylase